MFVCVVAPLAARSAPAVPARAKDARPSIAVLQVAPDPVLGADLSRLIEEQVAFALGASQRFSRVVAPGDMRDLLGFEKNKQVLGCQEGSACVAEIAGALGVDYLAAAKVGRLERTTLVYLNLLDSQSATARARARRQFTGVDAMPASIDELVVEVVRAIAPVPEPKPVPAPELAQPKPGGQPVHEAAPPERIASSATTGRGGTAVWVSLGAAVVAGAAGGVLGWRSQGLLAGASRTDRLAWADAQASASTAALGANVSYGVAGAAALAAVVLWVLERRAAGAGGGDAEGAIP